MREVAGQLGRTGPWVEARLDDLRDGKTIRVTVHAPSADKFSQAIALGIVEADKLGLWRS